jgi:hypothetical protein
MDGQVAVFGECGVAEASLEGISAVGLTGAASEERSLAGAVSARRFPGADLAFNPGFKVAQPHAPLLADLERRKLAAFDEAIDRLRINFEKLCGRLYCQDLHSSLRLTAGMWGNTVQ